MTGETVSLYKQTWNWENDEQGQLHYLVALTAPLNVINQYVPCMTCKGSL